MACVSPQPKRQPDGEASPAAEEAPAKRRRADDGGDDEPPLPWDCAEDSDMPGMELKAVVDGRTFHLHRQVLMWSGSKILRKAVSGVSTLLDLSHVQPPPTAESFSRFLTFVYPPHCHPAVTRSRIGDDWEEALELVPLFKHYDLTKLLDEATACVTRCAQPSPGLFVLAGRHGLAELQRRVLRDLGARDEFWTELDAGDAPDGAAAAARVMLPNAAARVARCGPAGKWEYVWEPKSARSSTVQFSIERVDGKLMFEEVWTPPEQWARQGYPSQPQRPGPARATTWRGELVPAAGGEGAAPFVTAWWEARLTDTTDPPHAIRIWMRMTGPHSIEYSFRDEQESSEAFPAPTIGAPCDPTVRTIRATRRGDASARGDLFDQRYGCDAETAVQMLGRAGLEAAGPEHVPLPDDVQAFSFETAEGRTVSFKAQMPACELRCTGLPGGDVVCKAVAYEAMQPEMWKHLGVSDGWEGNWGPCLVLRTATAGVAAGEVRKEEADAREGTPAQCAPPPVPDGVMTRRKAAALLGLELTPPPAAGAINHAYRTLAMKWHPDRHGGCPEATAFFQALSGAKTLLMRTKGKARGSAPAPAAGCGGPAMIDDGTTGGVVTVSLPAAVQAAVIAKLQSLADLVGCPTELPAEVAPPPVVAAAADGALCARVAGLWRVSGHVLIAANGEPPATEQDAFCRLAHLAFRWAAVPLPRTAARLVELLLAHGPGKAMQYVLDNTPPAFSTAFAKRVAVAATTTVSQGKLWWYVEPSPAVPPVDGVL